MQTISNAIQIAHQLLLKNIVHEGVYVDGTMGNGIDTCFIANHTHEKSKIYAFDIQEQAIENTKKFLAKNLINSKVDIKLVLDSHSNINQYIKSKINGAIFNLGYLPNAEKNITTQVDTTIKAIKNVIDLLCVNGVLAIVLYPGHETGMDEYQEVEKFVISLPKKYFTVGWYKMINHNSNAPALCWIEKVGDPV